MGDVFRSARWLAAAGLVIAGCSSEGSVASESGPSAPEPAPGSVDESLLPAADEALSSGCAGDGECVVVKDPCGRATAVHRDGVTAYHAQFAHRQYRCPPAPVYATPPAATCRNGRCYAFIPGG